MPSDKHNSITAKDTGLIFSLFNVTLALEVPFGAVCTMHSSWTYQCPPLYPIHFLLTAKSVDMVIACDGFLV